MDATLRRELESLGVNLAAVKESFVRSQGAGGQNVNKVSTCVVLHYPPLHITIKMQDSRAQAENREAAWHLLRDKIRELRQARAAAAKAAREQARRRKRTRPKWLKRELVKFKTQRATRKSARRRPARDD